MALNVNSSIFDKDNEDSAPKEKVYEGPAFQIYNYDANEKGTTRLTNWLFRTVKRDTADDVAELYGGTPEDNTGQNPNYGMQVQSERDSLDVIITDLSSDFQLWVNGNLIHHCNGKAFLSDAPDGGKAGDACACAKRDIGAMKKAFKDGYGPGPVTKVYFRLADDEQLGKGYLKSGGWDMAKRVASYLGAKLADAVDRDPNGEIFAQLFIEQVEYTPEGSSKTHKWNFPNLRDIKPFNDAIAEEPCY